MDKIFTQGVKRASVMAAYMQVSCSLSCGGRVYTLTSCTWGWRRADLKQEQRGGFKNVAAATFNNICFVVIVWSCNSLLCAIADFPGLFL